MATKEKKHPEYQYLDLLQDILDNGVKNVDEGTDSVSQSVFGRQLRFDLSEGFPLLTTKRVYWKGVLHELYWFLSGQSNIKYLIDNNVHIWDDYPYKYYKEAVVKGEETDMSKDEFIEKLASDDTFAETWGELPFIYGEMWRRWPAEDGRTVDQIQWVIDELRQDPDARNCIVNSWNPQYLYSMAITDKAPRFPVCHNMYQVSVKGGKLSINLYQRSADMFLGVPFNIASYALLVHIFAEVTGYKPGDFIHTFGDVHIYENHIDQVKEQLTREPRDFPEIKLKQVRNIDEFRPDQVELDGYDPHKTIKGKLTIAGGIKMRDREKT